MILQLENYTEWAIWVLRLAPAITMFLFGINQMIKPEPWFEYIPAWLQRIIPPSAFMRIHGFGNVLISLFLVSGIYPLIAAWTALIWFITIVPNAMRDNWKTGMRDLSITINLIALILLQS